MKISHYMALTSIQQKYFTGLVITLVCPNAWHIPVTTNSKGYFLSKIFDFCGKDYANCCTMGQKQNCPYFLSAGLKMTGEPLKYRFVGSHRINNFNCTKHLMLGNTAILYAQ